MNNPWKENLAERLNPFINNNNNYNLPNNANINNLLMILRKNNPNAMNNNDFKYFAVEYSHNGPQQLREAFMHKTNLITNNMRNKMIKNITPYNRNMLLKTVLNNVHTKNAVSQNDLHRVSILVNRNVVRSPETQRLIKNEVMGSKRNSRNRAQLVNLLAKYMKVNASSINALQKKGLSQNVIRQIYRK